MKRGGKREGSGRKPIVGKDIKIKLPFETIDTIERLYGGDSLSDKIRESISSGIRSSLNNYGVVYTPSFLSEFVAWLCKRYFDSSKESLVIFDPACGECSLLEAASKQFTEGKRQIKLIGNDVDNHYVQIANNEGITFFNYDALFPDAKLRPEKFWKKKTGNIDLIIENPPWSGDKIYKKTELQKNNYVLGEGQYDAFSLFIEMSLRIADEGTICAFIVPDSIFTSEDDSTRKYILNHSNILAIARLGEKLFPSVHRSTAVVVCQKGRKIEHNVECFRLLTEDKKNVLNSKDNLINLFEKKLHIVPEKRFVDSGYVFDIDTTDNDVSVLSKIKKGSSSLSEKFTFGRGVEISKKGNQVKCPHCGIIQPFLGSSKTKKCQRCGEEFDVQDNIFEMMIDNKKSGFSPILVGENIQRYYIKGHKYVLPKMEGINYKEDDLYKGAKILVRKTGLGIKASYDGGDHETFDSKQGYRYVEAHHLIPMKAQKDFPNINLDRTENIVALCPTCHRAVHLGTKEEKMKHLKPLYDERMPLLQQIYPDFSLTFEDLIREYYR